jgi:hypothetical protein
MTWANNGATMLEPFLWDCMLVEECGSDHRAFDVDMVTQFPNSLYRYMSHNWSGLVTHLVTGAPKAWSGDDKRLDRQYLGRALLNDIGVAFSGPHGRMQHKQQCVRLLSALADWGFYDDTNVEMLPFWRNGAFVRLGGDAPPEKVYCTVYRRPLADGKGYKALFVLMNESFKDVETRVTIADPARILGGQNTLTAGAVLSGVAMPKELASWWAAVSGPGREAPVLRDIETGEIIADDEGEAYGPVFVRTHDYRVLQAEHRTE